MRQLEQERNTFEPYWRDVKAYLVPNRGRFLNGASSSEVNDGKRNDDKIINGAAGKALEVMYSGMQSGLTSKAREWYDLKPRQYDGHYTGSDVTRYLKLVKGNLNLAFDRSNLYNALLEVYAELGAFGTAALAVLPHPDKVFYFRAYTIGTYYLSMNSRLEVDAFFTFEFPTVRQLVEEYGVEHLTQSTRNMYENGAMETRVKICCAVLRNPERIGIKMPPDHPVGEFVWEDCAKDGDGKGAFLKVGFFRSFPIMAPRWSTVDRDVYGWSPTRTVLGDIKMLQMLERDLLEGLGKLVNPPMQGPPELERIGVNASRGGYNTVYSENNYIRPLYQVQPDSSAIGSEIQRVERNIQRAYYNDLFIMLQQKDLMNKTEMTATEVSERNWEKMMSLGPVLERIHYELLNPLIERCMEMLYYAGRIPEPPAELQDYPARIEYLSVLSQAQKAVAVKQNEMLMSYVGQLGQFRPDALQKIDVDRAIEDYGESIGASSDLLVPSKEFKAQLEQQKKMAQEQQGMEALGGMVNAARTAGEINSGNLRDVVSNLTGAGVTGVLG